MRSECVTGFVTFGIAAVTAVPALVWLFVLVNRRAWATDEGA